MMRRDASERPGGWDAPAPAVRTRSARLLEEVRAGELSLGPSHDAPWLQPPLHNRLGASGRGGAHALQGVAGPQAPPPFVQRRITELSPMRRIGRPSAALDPFANTRFHGAQRQRAVLLRKRSLRASAVRWAALPAAALGFASAYIAVLVGAASCECEGGTMAGVVAAFVLAACLAAAALALQGWRCVVAAWVAGGVVAGVAPACLAAASQLGVLRWDAVEAALAAAPAAGVPLAELNFSTSPVLASAPHAGVFLVRDLVARLDLLGEGVSYWPLCVVLRALHVQLKPDAACTLPLLRAVCRDPAGRAATPVSWAARGVTPGADAAVGTFCVAPLVPITWPAEWGAPGDAPPPAWAACHNGFAGEASCAAALQRTYAAADATAHAPLAECLQRLADALAPVSGNTSVMAGDAIGPVVLALPSAELLEAPWTGDAAALAAPAVRRAVLSYGLSMAPEEYDMAVVLRCGAD
jgi:hypothetical protein